MSLTLIVVGAILSVSPLLPMATQSQDAPQSAPTAQAPATGTAAQENSQPKQKPSESKPSASAPGAQAAAGHKPARSKHSRRKRKAVPPDCNLAASAPADSSSGAPKPAQPAADATTASAPSNCPPSKIIVRKGGTSEPAIHLAGGPEGEKAAQQRDSANQMLQAAEQNLKKAQSNQLTANQQDVVKQVRQFMEQSKAAAGAGDLDRARTLAWKAQLLSEEVLNAQR